MKTRASRRSLVWAGALLVAVLVGAWRLAPRLLAPGRDARADSNASINGGNSGTGERPAHAARSVGAVVAARNRAEPHEADAFTGADWRMVSTAAPDPRLETLDATLLGRGERELRAHIASTVPRPALAPRLGLIARQAHEAATRVAAVEALGRINSPEAQAQLLSLLREGELTVDEPARRAATALLRPSALDDALTPRIAALLDAPLLTREEKQQIAFTLALVGLRDGVDLPPSVELSPAARQLFEAMTTLAQEGAARTPRGGAQ